MSEYGEDTYGEAWVHFYDDPLLGWPDPTPAVNFLARHAAGGSALDLGAGTGRVAIPLATAGVAVTAVDISRSMVERMRAKAGDTEMTIVQGDIRERCVDGEFDLVYCIGQSFLQLQSQHEQRQALLAMRSMLAPGGRIILECLTPDLRRFRVGQDVLANRIVSDAIVTTSSIHDPGKQQIHSMTMRSTAAGNELFPNFIRYLWPSELALLAELCGLAVEARFSSWVGRPYAGGPGAYIVELVREAA